MPPSPALCPTCASPQVLEIVYGKPTAPTRDRAERGEIKLGGCIVTGEDPNRVCMACGTRWIDRSDPHWLEREELLKRLAAIRARKKE